MTREFTCTKCGEVFVGSTAAGLHTEAVGHSDFTMRDVPASPPSPTTPAPRTWHCYVCPFTTEDDESARNHCVGSHSTYTPARSRPAAPSGPVCCDNCGVWYGEYPLGFVCASCGGVHFVAAGILARPAAPQGGEPSVSATDEGSTKNGQLQVQEPAAQDALERQCNVLARRADLLARQRDRYIPCADHRDKVTPGECQVCAKERAVASLCCNGADHDGVQCDRRRGHWGDCAASRGPNDTILWTSTTLAATVRPESLELAVDRSWSSTKSAVVAEDNVFRGAPETAPLDPTDIAIAYLIDGLRNEINRCERKIISLAASAARAIPKTSAPLDNDIKMVRRFVRYECDGRASAPVARALERILSSLAARPTEAPGGETVSLTVYEDMVREKNAKIEEQATGFLASHDRDVLTWRVLRDAVNGYDYLRRDCPDEVTRDAGWALVMRAMGYDVAIPERPERASSLISERSERLRGLPQTLVQEALTPLAAPITEVKDG